MKKYAPRFLAGLLILFAFLGHVGKFWEIPLVAALEHNLYDARLRLFMPNTLDDRVVVVDIDEKSLAEIGHWPWGRDQMATLVRRLTDDYWAAVVGFDVVFAEPDDSSGLKSLELIGQTRLKGNTGYLQALQELRLDLDYDRRFAETLGGQPVVLGYYFSNLAGSHRSGTLPPPVFGRGAFGQLPQNFVRFSGFGANLAMFQAAAARSGHFNPLLDFDGNTRRVPLLVEFDGQYYESLSLAMVRTFLGQAELEAGFPEAASPMEWVDIISPRTTLRVPVDREVAALVPYRGPEKSFCYMSAADVIKGRLDPADFAGRIVLVGTTAPGLNDLRATPVGSGYPGVEVHANLIAGILDGNIKEHPSYLLAAEVLILALLGGLLVFILPHVSPARGTLLALAVLGGFLGGNLALWESANLVMPLAGTTLALLLIYVLNMAWGYFVESRTKRQFAELFGQYVPPELVDEMAKDPETYTMEGRNEQMTVLFSDVRSFTTISEGLDPKELARLMNEYLGAMTLVIRQHRGTLDKYIGDAIMAFWGAPVADADHALHAVETALAMQVELRTLDEPFQARGWPRLQIGIGINTGTMTVGDMGSPVRKSYTVMGDAVNLGSRLEGITKEYGVGIVAGEETVHQAPAIAFRELDRVRVKGKDEPVAIYEPLGRVADLGAVEANELARWHEALALFRHQAWDEAESRLQKLQAEAPERPLYTLYLDRIEHLRQHPPGPDWDGVTTFKTK